MAPLPPFARAAVFHAPREPLTIESFRLQEPEGSAAIARIRCTTICGSDLHTYYGRRASPAPSVLGHEMVGEICALGADGAQDFDGHALAVGDRVTWSMVWSCGSCFYCTRGLRPKCESLMKFGHERIGPGRELIGGFAECCVLRAGTALFRVPENVPDLVASPANCATATVAAVCRTAGALAGETVIVYGAGMLGLTACAMASAGGAARVMAVEVDPARAELAPLFGAAEVLDGRRPADDLRQAVLSLTEGRGAGVVLELTGMPDAIESAYPLLRFGGRLIMAGSTFPARPVQLPAEQLVRRMLRVEGVYNYQPEDLAAALQFLSSCVDRFPFDRLTGRSFTLDQVQEAFEYAETMRPPRAAVIPMAVGS